MLFAGGPDVRFSFSRPNSGTHSRSPQALVFVLLLAAALLAARHWSSSPVIDPSGQRMRCPVLSVTDGDTLRVEYQGREERIRMLRINTPERGAPGSKQASERLRKLVQGGIIGLEFETPAQEERDSYKRLLAYVFVGDTNVNVELVRQGWSRFYDRHGEGKYAEAFRAAEREAREARRGIWLLETE
jgi:endonuclease YncB( thermonuclease family)